MALTFTYGVRPVLENKISSERPGRQKGIRDLKDTSKQANMAGVNLGGTKKRKKTLKNTSGMPDSCACGMNNLELFQVPPTNIALEESKWEEYYPISSTIDSDTAPIEFEIKGQGDQYLDLSQTYLQMVCQFTQNDGSALAGDAAKIAPVNNILHSMFTEINRLWEFPAQLLAAAQDGSVTISKPILTEYPDNSKNEGFRKRNQAIAGSKKITLLDRLHLDLFQQDRFLPNGVDVRLRFNRARPAFYLMTGQANTGKIKILSMVLWVRKIKPAPTLMNQINQNLNTHRAKYPLRRVEVKTFTIPTGTQSKITDHLFQGQMPKRLILGFVENAAFNGDKTKNPFHFQNFGIKKLDVSINGETMSNRCFEPNFNDDLYLRSYLSLYQALGKLVEDWAPDITLEKYKSGFTLWC
ncbi:uncharacterized protein F54H12.2-like [Saccostrea cucullata]|uniref:uncharacterized protein F54H12.2-like n=1 Tax=Saccostrea cuccullata TaxID=36930 RepID=UPI002ED00A40